MVLMLFPYLVAKGQCAVSQGPDSTNLTGDLLGLFEGLVDRTDHVEGLLG